MNFLIRLFSSIAQAFHAFNVVWWEAVKYVFRNITLLFVALFIVIKSCYDWVIHYINKAVLAVSDLNSISNTADLSSPGDWILQILGLMDNFMPVGVVLGALVAFGFLWIACITYRFVKSWILGLS